MNEKPFNIGGYREAVIGVSDPAPWLALLCDLGGWREIHRCAGSGAGVAHEFLLGEAAWSTGMVRLLHSPDAPAPPVNRARCHTWDTGGLFDLDIRVRDVRAMQSEMERLGWAGLSEPIDWRFGELQVREWLARGPDDVVFALMQRLSPALAAPPGSGFSHAFNSSQTVRSVEASMNWYHALGFETVVHQSAPLDGRGGEVLGLAPEEAPRQQVDLAILSANGAVDGSVELVALPGKPGIDVSGQVCPTGRGLARLRFPVEGLDALAARIRALGLAAARSLHRSVIEPWGNVDIIALRTPDGAWLEFFEETT